MCFILALRFPFAAKGITGLARFVAALPPLLQPLVPFVSTIDLVLCDGGSSSSLVVLPLLVSSLSYGTKLMTAADDAAEHPLTLPSDALFGEVSFGIEASNGVDRDLPFGSFSPFSAPFVVGRPLISGSLGILVVADAASCCFVGELSGEAFDRVDAVEEGDEKGTISRPAEPFAAEVKLVVVVGLTVVAAPGTADGLLAVVVVVG